LNRHHESISLDAALLHQRYAAVRHDIAGVRRGLHGTSR
jgi:hypothetical protein